MDERILFKYKASWGDWNWGTVLITDQRVMLSGRAWNLAEIASVQLVTAHVRTRRLSLTQLPSKAMMAGWVLGVVAALVLSYDKWGTHSDLLEWLGFLLFLTTGGCIAYGALHNYADVYRLQLTLTDGRQQVVDSLLWYPDDARSARRTVEAITQALAIYHDADK